MVHLPELQSRQPRGLITRQKHPALSSEHKTSMALLFNYNPTILQYGSAAGAVVSVAILKKKSELSASAWLRFFRYVDKMAAVECVKCTLLHTQRFCCYKIHHLGPLSTLLFAAINIGTP